MCSHNNKSCFFSPHRATYQLKESNATLLNERNKSFASGVLDLDSLGSLSYGDTKGPLSRGVSLGLPLLSPASEGQSSRVGDFISKVCMVFTIKQDVSSYSKQFPERTLSLSVFIVFLFFFRCRMSWKEVYQMKLKMVSALKPQ